MTRLPRAASSVAALLGLLCATVLSSTVLAAPALASGPGPTAGQVAASKATVAQREQQVAKAAIALGQAKARFERLNTAAEVVVEAYDEAEVKLSTAQRAASTAENVLALASAQVAKSQLAVAHFARAAYETGGVSAIDAMLSPGGARTLVARVGALDAISVSQHRTLTRLDAASIYRVVVARQAESVAGQAREAATVAAKAKSAAESAVLHQQKVLTSLHHERARLTSLLSDAQANASRLQRERLAALAQQQTASAVASSEPPPSGPSPYANQTGDLSGTVSASTGEAAVREAESQIGKPYQWGAAGPDSYDCSGLVMWAYDQVGVHLEHWTGFQWEEGAHVAVSDLQPGDLLFFAYNTSDPDTIHHVGMYIGNGEMVEAPYTGANVQISSDSRPDFIGAIRPYQR